MATALPTAVFLSGLSDEDVKDALETTIKIFNREITLFKLRKKFPEPLPSVPKLANPKVTLSESPDKQKVKSFPFSTEDNDNYYLEVADALERKLFGPISPPKRAVRKIDECDSIDTLTKENHKSLSASIALKCQESPDISVQTLGYVCSVIDELEKMYKSLVMENQQESDENQQMNQAQHDLRSCRMNCSFFSSCQHEQENGQIPVRKDQKAVKREEQKQPEEQQKQEQEEKKSPCKIMYNNSNILDLYGNVRDYNFVRHPKVLIDKRGNNGSIYYPLEEVGVNARYEMVPCPAEGCPITVPRFY